MQLVYNSNSTMHLPALMQIKLARETGWDGVFLREEHLRRYLAEGYDLASLRAALAGLEPVNIGALADVERWRPDERAGMLREAERADGAGRRRRRLVRPGPDRPGPAGRRLSRAGGPVPGGTTGGHGECAASRRPCRRGPRDSLLPRADRLDAPGAARRGRRGGRRSRVRQRRPGPRLLAPVAGRNDARRDRPARSRGSSSGSTSPTRSDRPVRRIRTSAAVGCGPARARFPLREWVAAVRATGFDGWWDNELYSPLHWELADPVAVGERASRGPPARSSGPDRVARVDAARGPMLRSMRNRLLAGGLRSGESGRLVASGYPAGPRRRILLKDVATSANVSGSTASRALADDPRISLATRLSVKAAAAELNYVPNAAARSLRMKHTRTLGLLIPDLRDPVHGQVASGFEEEARRSGYCVIIVAGENEPARERLALKIFAEHGADGVAIVSSAISPREARERVDPERLVLVQPDHSSLPRREGSPAARGDPDRRRRRAARPPSITSSTTATAGSPIVEGGGGATNKVRSEAVASDPPQPGRQDGPAHVRRIRRHLARSRPSWPPRSPPTCPKRSCATTTSWPWP